MQVKINKFIHDIQSAAPEQAENIELIRKLFNQSSKSLSEEIKYGGFIGRYLREF